MTGTQDQDQDTTRHGTPPEKERNTDKAGKPEYICIFAGTEKSIKKVKKNLEIRKNRRIFVAVIKQQTSLIIKLQSNENNKQRNNFREYPRTRIYD